MKILRYLKKVLEYAFFLWKDEDYDWIYIVRSYDYKLKRTAEHLKKHSIIEESHLDRLLKEIGVVRKLFKRIMADKYFENAENAMKQKYGQDYSRYVDKISVFYHIVNGLPPTDYFEKFSESEKAAIQDERLQMLLTADNLKQRDIERAFNLIGKNIQRWWD